MRGRDKPAIWPLCLYIYTYITCTGARALGLIVHRDQGCIIARSNALDIRAFPNSSSTIGVYNIPMLRLSLSLSLSVHRAGNAQFLVWKIARGRQSFRECRRCRSSQRLFASCMRLIFWNPWNFRNMMSARFELDVCSGYLWNFSLFFSSHQSRRETYVVFQRLTRDKWFKRVCVYTHTIATPRCPWWDIARNCIVLHTALSLYFNREKSFERNNVINNIIWHRRNASLGANYRSTISTIFPNEKQMLYLL